GEAALCRNIRRAGSALDGSLADAAGGAGERQDAAGLGQRRQPRPARPDRPVQPAVPTVSASPGPRQQRHGEGDRAVAGRGRSGPLRLLRWLPAFRYVKSGIAWDLTEALQQSGLDLRRAVWPAIL